MWGYRLLDEQDRLKIYDIWHDQNNSSEIIINIYMCITRLKQKEDLMTHIEYILIDVNCCTLTCNWYSAMLDILTNGFIKILESPS